MNRLAAHELLAGTYAEDPERLQAWLPEDVEPRPVHGIDPCVAMLTAAASLSGQLADAETLADVRDACAHFASLWAAEIVTAEQWNAEVLEVIGELLAWGDRATAFERN
jgi:hypothetical protein